MPNLQRIQLAWNKSGVTVIGRAVRQIGLYYFDFVAGGNTFVATDSANTQISMPGRSAPQDYIYESATFDIETWDDGWYEWQAYDSVDKLLGLTPYYLEGGKIATGSMLAEIKERTDNLPDDPASEPNATANTNLIVAEVNENEVKIDIIDGNVDLIKDKTDNLPAIPASEPNATANKSEIIAEINGNEVKIDDIKLDTTAIEAKTDNLPVDPASQSQVEAAITLSEIAIRSDINDVPEAVWEVDIEDTEQPTIIQKAKYWLGLISSIMRKQ